MKHGFIKVAAAAPEIRVADPMFNADAVIRAMDEHARLGVKVLVFPELTLTGATCGDLFYQNTLLAGAAAALEKVVQASEGKDMLVFVGLPVGRELLELELDIGGGTDDALWREYNLIYQCVTLPAETLAVSYPLFDGNGTPTRPSFLVTRIAQLFGTLPRPATQS